MDVVPMMPRIINKSCSKESVDLKFAVIASNPLTLKLTGLAVLPMESDQ